MGAQAPYLAEGFPHPVEHHHGFIHRITQHGQDRRQHREGEFPLEEGEEAQDDHHVVQVGDDGGNGEAPFKAEGQVDDDADDHQEQGQGPVGGQFLTHLGPHEFHPAQGGGSVLGVEGAHDGFTQLGGVLFALQGQANQHILGGTEVLHGEIAVARVLQGTTHFLQIGGLAVMDFDQGAPGEFHGQVEAPGGEEENGRYEGDRRNDVEHQRMAHEGNVFVNAEEFHGGFLTWRCRQRCRASRFGRWPVFPACDGGRRSDSPGTGRPPRN